MHSENLSILYYESIEDSKIKIKYISSEGHLNKGYGTNVFHALIKLCIHYNFTEIYGEVKPDPPAYRIRVTHFFEKNFCTVSNDKFYLKLTHVDELLLKMNVQQLVEHNKNLQLRLKEQEQENKRLRLNIQDLERKIIDKENQDSKKPYLSKLFHRI